MRLRKRDIAGGAFTLGERLQIAAILRDEERDDVERTRDLIAILHGVRPPRFVALLMADYIVSQLEGFTKWLELEQTACSVPPIPEAMQAGADKMAENVGDLGMVVSIADRFGWTFAQVYAMPYLDAFSLWKVDAERAKFERRLQKVINNKHKSKK